MCQQAAKLCVMLKHLIFVILLLPTLAFGKDSLRAERVADAWLDWLDEHNISRGNLAVLYNGEPVRIVATGRSEAEPIALASLSKSVTGACIAALVKRGDTRYDATVSQILGPEAHGSDLTIAELLSHSTGLGPDSTQETMSKWKRLGQVQHAAITQTALSRDAQTGKRGTYGYNNENYGVLGRIVETLTNQSYEDACRDLVLTPAGVTTAELPKLFGAYGAMGGWWMTADDFGRFVDHALRDGDNPFKGPKASLGGGAYYGRGTLFREWNSGFNYWHFGAVCLRKNSTQSYFASWTGGWSVVTGFDGCIEFSNLFGLDAALSKAALR